MLYPRKESSLRKIRSNAKGEVYIGQALPKTSKLPTPLKEARVRDSESIKELKRRATSKK